MGNKELIANQCVVCLEEDVQYIDSKVAKQEMTDKEAAAHFKVSNRMYTAHYEMHVARELINALSTDITPLKEIVIDKINTVAESVDRLRLVVLKMGEVILKDMTNFDSKDITALGQMERNLTQTVKDLALLQGEISTGDTLNVQFNITQAEKLTDIMMENACPTCKKVFLTKLEN